MKTPLLTLALLPALAAAQSAAPIASSTAPFALRNGDRVVFYGDSITEQRLYTLFAETFVRTRFPKLDATFVHSGWGGDTVTGGWGGNIDDRLKRDVFPYKPTVVTVMLAMNDAGYRSFDEPRFDTFAKGYDHIVDRLRREAPNARLTLIQPSPYDDVTRAPGFPGGYNATLVRYGDYVKTLGTRNGATIADLNTPVVTMLQAANAKDPATAQKIIPDRIHPGDGGHLTMAEALLKAWNAPSVVSAVEIDGGKAVRAENARVSGLSGSPEKGWTWTQTDGALPFPINLDDPAVRLVVDSSDFVQALDQQTVRVGGLAGRYALTIDGKAAGTFDAAQLASGVNLATLDTPMRDQAWRVFWLVRNHGEVHQQLWRSLRMNLFLAGDDGAPKAKQAAFDALDKYDEALDLAARKAAQPKPHLYRLVPAP